WIGKELLTESLVFGLMGGVLGVALAYAGLKLVVAMGPSNLPRLQDISMDPRVISFALVGSLVSSALFALIPAIKYTSPIGLTLDGGHRGMTATRERNKSQNALVIVQVALALVLLVSCGLMIRTFQALRNLQTGFADGEKIQTARIWFPSALVREPE